MAGREATAGPSNTTPPVFTAEQQILIRQIVAQALEAAEAQRTATTVAHASTKDLNLGKIKPFAGKLQTLEKFLMDCKLHFVLKPDVYNTDDRKVGFILSREWHRYKKPAGKYMGFCGVGVRVGDLDPIKNPYPICRMAGKTG